MDVKAECRSRLEGIRNLPTLPQAAILIVEVLNNPDTKISRVQEVLARDTSLAATILKIVNSSYYGLRHHVTSLSHAVNLLGYRVVKNIVLTAAASGLFRARHQSQCFDAKAFSTHSIASAAVCRYLAHYAGKVDPETAYSVGLLHDIGKMVLDQCYAQEYSEAVMSARRQRLPVHPFEKALCGLNHAEAGEALLGIWRFPADLAEVIGRHHEKVATAQNDFNAVLHIADYACTVKNYRCFDRLDEPELDPEAWRCLHLGPDVLQNMLAALDTEIERAREMFALAAG